MLFRGMRNVMDAFNALQNYYLLPNDAMNANSVMVPAPPQQRVCKETPHGKMFLLANFELKFKYL